jgi:hypothetical protein
MHAAATPPASAASPPDAWPYPHGPFLVEPDGALRTERAPAVRFAWRGRRCAARIDRGRLHISVGAGHVPYTAERPAARPQALAAIAALPAELPDGWRLRLTPAHALDLEQECALATPLTATSLIAALVSFALALDAYLERLDSAGVAAPGRLKT